MIETMATVSCQELARKQEELATRLGPLLRPDGFAEFSEYVEKACTLQNTDETNSLRLAQEAAKMLPRVERSVEKALSMRDQIRAKMLEHAREGVKEYHDALKELSK